MKRHLFTVICISLLASILMLFPHWYAYRATPPGSVFSGQATWFDPWDISVYVAAVRWGQQHSFLMENTFTAEANPAILYYPVYTLAGRVVRFADPFLVFYGLSIVTTAVLVLVLTTIAAHFWHDRKTVFAVVAATVFGGGIGIVFFPELTSLDTAMTSSTFHSAVQRPHEAVAVAAFIGAVFGFYSVVIEKNKQHHSWTVAAVMTALLLYPYNALSFFGILGIFSVWQFGSAAWSETKKIMVPLLLAAGVVVAGMAVNLSFNQTFSGVISQQLASVTLIPFLSCYFFVLIPCSYTIGWIRPLSALQKLLITWIVVCSVLAFLPFGISRFFLRGIFFPFVLLAFLSLDVLVERFAQLPWQYLRTTFLVYFVILVSITSIGIFSLRINESTTKRNTWYYFTKDEAAALEYLARLPERDLGVLSSYRFGNAVPAHTNQRAYFGHLIQSPEKDLKVEKLKQFYTGAMSDAEAIEFLNDENIKFIFRGSEETELHPEPLEYSFLESAFESGVVELLKVQHTPSE